VSKVVVWFEFVVINNEFLDEDKMWVK